MSGPNGTQRFAWERALMSESREDLPASARLLGFVLATYTDPDLTIPGRFSPSLTAIQNRSGLSRTAVKTHLITLESRGWLTRTPPDVSLARRFHARTTYVLTFRGEARTSDDPDLGRDTPQSGSSAGHNQNTQTDYPSHPLVPPSPTAGEPREPSELPSDWVPNYQHAVYAERLAADSPSRMGFEEQVDCFRIALAGKRRKDWDRTFTAFLRSVAEDLVDRDFPSSIDWEND